MNDKELHNRLRVIDNAIRSLEAKISSPRQEAEASGRPEETSPQEDHAAQWQAALKHQVPPAPKDSEQSQKPWHKTLNGWKTLAELVAIPFAIGYAIVTFCQWRDLRHNFEVDQRPYVYHVSVEDQTAINAKMINISNSGAYIMGVEVKVRNYGKSPAMNMESASDILVGDAAKPEQIDKWFDSVGTPLKSSVFEKIRGGHLMANGQPSFPRVLMQADPFFLLINPSVANSGANLDMPYVIVARVQYYDTTGNRYWSDLCISRAGRDMPHVACLTHNEIH